MADRTAPKIGGGTVTLDDTAFGVRFNEGLVHEAVRAEQAARRQGTAATKTRGKVSGGGSKPWRQKGTGRARAGSTRSPVWRGGGTIFGPNPRHYVVKVNRKARKGALRSALSVHAERGSLAILDASVFTEPSTKQAAGILDDWGREGRVLVLLGAEENAAGKSFRNIAGIGVLPVDDAGVTDIIGSASLLVSEVALQSLTERAVAKKEAA